jgi:hypothetical protein
MIHARPILLPTLLLTAVCRVIAQDGSAALPIAGGPESVFSPFYDLTIVHVNTPGHATNVVPGVGAPFRTGGTGTSAFERPWICSTGANLAINVVAGAPAVLADDDVLLRNGALLLREGSPAPWAAGQNVGTIDPDLAINAAGQILFGNNVAPATTADDYIAFYDGTTWSSLAQEGQPTPVGGTWGSTIDSTALSNAGGTYWRDASVAGLPTASNGLVVLGSLATVLQKGIDVPIAQAGGATNTWENFTINRVYVSPDGAQWMVVGDTNAATTADLVLAVNNVVLIQEGQVLPGSSFVSNVSAIGKAWFDGAGNWYARGSNADGNDWVVRNGAVLADSSGTSEVVAGTGEFFDDATFTTCFFCMDGNALGQRVFGGVTTASATSNGVLVFEDASGFRRVIARESDPIDMNGNGLFDDDRFFNTFGDDDVLLQDDGSVVFTATLKNAAGTAVDQGLFKLVPRSASCTSRNGSNINPVALSCTTLPVLGTTWSLAVTSGPQTVLTGVFFSTAPLTPTPLLGYELLIALPIAEMPTTFPLPSAMKFLGIELFLQGLRVDWDGFDFVYVPTNAQDVVIGF